MMSLALTKKAAAVARRRLRRACEEVRSGWSRREQRSRRLEAFDLQMQLAIALGLKPAPLPVRKPAR